MNHLHVMLVLFMKLGTHLKKNIAIYNNDNNGSKLYEVFYL